jgi:putative ABC transport system permease protein
MPARRPFWFLRRRPDEIRAEIDEELDTHLTMRVEELKARGWTGDEARREAQRQFGDRERAARYCRQEDLVKARQVQRGLMAADLLQDMKICLRSLRRSPTLTAAIILTVGLGIGATTSIFAAIDAILLRPLPYPHPERLVRIYTDAAPNRYGFSVADYLALQREHTQFEQVAGYTDRAMTFTDGASSGLVRGRIVSWTYFDVLGLRPSIGRVFTEQDARPETPPAVVVSHAFWIERLGGRVDALGTPVRLDGADYVLAGVLSSDVGPLERDRDFFLTARWTEPRRKGPFFIAPIARLRRESDRAQAAAELKTINKRMFPVWRSSYQDDRATWNLTDLKTHIVGDTRTMAGVAVAAVSLMWMIACANASSLLLARVTSRRRELAVRSALGASRARVVRLLMAEGALLAIGAAAVGLAVAAAGLELFRHAGAAYLPRLDEVGLSGRTLLVWTALAGTSALLFGLIPALHGAGDPVNHSLNVSSRSMTDNVSARRGRRILVGTQFAIATPLLIAATLLLISLQRLERVDLGFDPHNVVTAAIRLPSAQYQNRARADALWTTVAARIGALPGVSAVSFADSRPPNGADNFNNFDLELFPTPPSHSQPVTPWVAVTPDYFRTLGLRLLEGRLFDERDGRDPAVDVIVVDRAWANRFFPGGSAVGKRLVSGGCTTCPLTTVVGVVSTVKYAGLDKPDDGTAYAPLEEAISRFLIVRTAVKSATVLPSIRQALRDADPSLALSNVASIDDLVAASLEVPRSLSWLIGALAGAALLLSAIGIYGVMAHYVQQHARDMCIRLALGGTAAVVGRHVVGQGMRVVVIGVLAGLMCALALTGLMSSLLFGIKAADPATFAGVAGLLLTIAGLACFLPARRAVRLDSGAILRSD